MIAILALWLLVGRNRPANEAASAAPAAAGKPVRETLHLPPVERKDRRVDSLLLRCGGSVLLHPEAAPAESAQLEAASTSLLKDIGAQLATQGLLASQASGQYLQMIAAADQFRSDWEQKDPQCATREGCPEAAARAAELGARGYRDALARLAAQSSDPQVYALAYYACARVADKPTDAGQCAQISARQWAHLDPSNALPWIYLANEAVANKQAPIAEEALFRASRAQVSDAHWSALSGLLDSPVFQAAPQDVQDATLITAMGVASAFSIPQYQVTMNYCSTDALKDQNRSQVCDALGTVMAERADNAISVSLGMRIGERLGWSAERLHVLANTKDALFQLARENSPAMLDDCQALAKTRAWTGAMLRYGEMEAFRRSLATSGRTTAQLSERYQAELARQREHEAAAHDATPAPDTLAPGLGSAGTAGQDPAPAPSGGTGAYF